MQGACFIIHNIEVVKAEEAKGENEEEVKQPASAQVADTFGSLSG